MSEPIVVEECGVCWASHSCHLPIRHDGDHACIDEDDEGEPHSTCPRAAPYVYEFYLLRYHDGDFCDVCGPVPPVEHIHGVLDHAMRAHPEIWAKEYAADYATYLGDGHWASWLVDPTADA